MKFPLAILTAVVLIFSSSLLVTAQLGDSEKSPNVSTIAEKINFTVPDLKEMKGDRGPAFYTSCKELYNEFNNILPTGYYNITTPQGVERVYCEMNTANCGNITGGWMRVAYIEAKNETYSCAKWQLTHNFVQSFSKLYPQVSFCSRSQTQTGKNGCFSIKFPTFGISYNKVCGRARGYQYGFTRAFHSYVYAGQRTLDDSYVSGLSVTRGEPGKREHIWTFAAGFSQTYGYATINCPCALYPGPNPPPFVGDNYFCDSGNPDIETVCGTQNGVIMGDTTGAASTVVHGSLLM